MVSVEEMDACDELLRQLGLRLAHWSESARPFTYLINSILKLGQSVAHVCKLPMRSEMELLSRPGQVVGAELHPHAVWQGCWSESGPSSLISAC